MSIPPSVGSGTITGVTLRTSDGSPVAGVQFIFTPALQPGLVTVAGSVPPVVIAVDPVVGVTNAAGVLCRPGGIPGVVLTASSDVDVSPSGWTWVVTTPGTSRWPSTAASFVLAPGEVKDLTTITTLSPSLGVEIAAWTAAIAAVTVLRDQAAAAAAGAVAGKIDTVAVDAKVAADIGVPASLTAAALNATYLPRGRKVFEAYDDFSRYTDGPLSGRTPLAGNPWQTTGAGPTTIISGRATSVSSGYGFQVLSGKVSGIACEVVFSGSGTGQCMTLAITSGTTIDLNNLAVHLNCGPLGFNLTVRKDGGTFDSILADTWLTPMVVDGVTPYRLAVRRRENAFFIDGPNGEQFSVVDARIGQLAGRVVFIQPGVSGSLTAGLNSFGAYSVDSTRRYSVESISEDIGPGGFPASGNGRMSGGRGTAYEVSLGFDGGSNLPAVIFGPVREFLANLQTAVIIGATTLVVDKYIPIGSTIQIESGSNTETVTAAANSTGSAPTFSVAVSATVRAHPALSAIAATVPSSYRARIFNNNGTLNIPGTVVFGSGATQVAIGGGPGGTGVFWGNAFDSAIFRAAAGVLSMRAQQVLRNGSGTTAQRPAPATAGLGAIYMDTTLAVPIWCDGTNWRNFTANTIV